MITAKRFSDFKIQTQQQSFKGDKIKIDRIINKEITVHDYEIKDSKYEGKGNGKCLYLQIAISSESRVVFTGSTILMDMIQQVGRDNLPFITTIVRGDNDRLEFT